MIMQVSQTKNLKEFETLRGSDRVRLLLKKPLFADKCDCCKIFNTLCGNNGKLLAQTPDIVKLIWENRHPSTLTLDKLRKGIPESWEEQRKLFLP